MSLELLPHWFTMCWIQSSSFSYTCLIKAKELSTLHYLGQGEDGVVPLPRVGMWSEDNSFRQNLNPIYQFHFSMPIIVVLPTHKYTHTHVHNIVIKKAFLLHYKYFFQRNFLCEYTIFSKMCKRGSLLHPRVCVHVCLHTSISERVSVYACVCVRCFDSNFSSHYHRNTDVCSHI